ncbi:MAG: histidinol dehydrogenase [Crocinitomicaceae bacterium]|nr:histidinol dehydrogenase [Crocinitomicaceae bacterium]
MKKYVRPQKEDWLEICSRPALAKRELTKQVNTVLESVRTNGDEAIRQFTNDFDGLLIENSQVTVEEIQFASDTVSNDLKQAIQLAKTNIEIFHKSQIDVPEVIETSLGVQCWRKSVAIEKVGLYIPGGSAPLFSTILMLGIPALIAGCEEIILCTPPSQDGTVNPAILYTASLVGVTKIFKIGGAQAIAAMAYGTESVPLVYKIFGTRNKYVTKAKELIQQDGIAIDMPAGPSEVLVIADSTCNPSFVASDLLSQAEHGADSQVILVTDNENVLNETMTELIAQLNQLPRKRIAQKALKNSKVILLNSIEDCMELSNYYAPEHLIIASENAERLTELIVNAGSVFLGNYSCESAGDYASGTNHTLPTNGYARNYSGVSLDSFVRKITFQKVSETGIKNIGPAIELMAEAEELFAHKNAVTLRLKALNDV